MPEPSNLLLFPDLHTPPERPTGPPDAAARAEALDIQRSFIVEAPAGSGKTGLLIQRFLKLLADESVTSPEQVLAITFTTKATAEMRDRVLERLEAAQRDPAGESITQDFARATHAMAREVLARDAQFAWNLLDHPHRLKIRTIDSLCAEIARSLPVLSGSGAALAPTTQPDLLFREAARRTLLLLGSAEPTHDRAFDAALRDLLLHRDGNLADCETLLAEMLALRDQWATIIPLDRASLDDAFLDSQVLPRLEAALEQAVCDRLTTLSAEMPPDVLADLAELASEMAHSDGYNGQLSPILVCQGRRGAPGNSAEDVEHWRALIHLLIKPSKPRDWRKSIGRNIVGFEIEKHHQAQLKSLIARLQDRPNLIEILCRIESLPPAQYPANQWTVAKSLFRVLSRALIELQLVFAERGQCDFTELSLVARTALRAGSGPEDLAAALGARLQHLLVDEMQDTSSGQYELIQLLTESWDGHSQTVFLVGDPRQSIYLFRQARVERFLDTLRTRRLGDLPLTRLRLTANFRSQQRLVGQFNDDFTRIFTPPANASPLAEALAYTAADAVLPASPDTEGLRWHAATVDLNPPDEVLGAAISANARLRLRQARRNASDICKIARRWLAKPLPAGRTDPWRIAVLVRSRSHLVEVVSELRAEDPQGRIPFRAVEIEPLNERQEILDLTGLTRALLHPGDRVASLALLRAPWCGLSLADLHMLTGADDPAFSKHSIQRLMEERGELLSPEACRLMARLWNVLEAAQAQRSRTTVAQLVERAWRSLGGDASLREDELINARRFFQLLDEIEADSPGIPIDTAVLDDRMKRLYAEPQAVPADSAFIELLTIHRAKGLEWDVVMIPALERSPGRGRSRLLTWAELDLSTASANSDAAPIMLAPIAARGEEIDDLTRWLKDIHREHEAAERKRLFYVAATRAREELHLFASPDRAARGDIRLAWDSLLKSAWAAAETHFTPAQPADAPARAAVFDLAAAASVHEMPLRNAAQEPTAITPELTEADLYPPALPNIERLPSTFDPAARFIAARAQRLPYSFATGSQAEGLDEIGRTPFVRPQGGYAARAFGTAVHALFELIAGRIAAGATPAGLLAELPQWKGRIAAILRASGLPPNELDRLARETRAALENALRDRDGAWLFASHANAATELAVIAAPMSQDSDALASIRVDRTFHAGPEPHASGADHLWIVDYKTTAHSGKGLDEFLTAQRAAYAPQLEVYARILAAIQGLPLTQLRLGLYYPAIPRLIWWVPEGAD